MSERTWIKVHSGLTSDPKHRKALGKRVWLFLWLIDHADWQTGVVVDYTDAYASGELDMPERTVERQRQELQSLGYIECNQGFQCQHIRVMKWRNPRLVNPPQINIPEDKTTYAELRTHGTKNCVPIPPENCVPLHYDHNDHKPLTSETSKSHDTDWVYEQYLLVFCEPVTTGESAALSDLAEVHDRASIDEAMQLTKSANARKRISRKVAYMRGILQDWAVSGKPVATGKRNNRNSDATSLRYKAVRLLAGTDYTDDDIEETIKFLAEAS
jgi:hypothetical protein